MTVRRKATPEEIAEAGGTDVVRQKATPEEVAEAKSSPVEPAKSPQIPEQPSTGRAVAEGAVQGGTYDFGDELQGFIGAILRRNPGAKALGYSPEAMGEENIFSPTGYGDSFMEDYRKERDAARRDRDAAKSAHPTAYGVSEVGSAILAPGPKTAKGSGISGFAKTGAKVGAAFGLGSSDADLTKGEVGEAALDTTAGGATGGALGAAGGVLNKYAIQPLAQKATEAGQRAFQRGVEKANKPIDAAINSARGSLGGEVAAGNRTLEVLRRLATDPSVPEDVSRGAAELLETAEAKGLDERVARSTIGQFFQRLPRIEKAQTGFDEALERGSPESRKAAVDALMNKSPMGVAILKNLARLGLPAAGFTADKMLGGSGAIGGGLGLVTGQLSGRPLTLLMNAAKQPSFQRSAAQMATRALEEAALGALVGLSGEQGGTPDSMTRSKLGEYFDSMRKADERRKKK